MFHRIICRFPRAIRLKHKNCQYRISCTVDGTRSQIIKSGFKTKTDAERAAFEVEKQLKRNSTLEI
ncbi:Arm DNA-binding domain-containing protein [Shouchella lonarensis]|uniref:Arm DNA-binding domain-containing protein n=1 Tax=Shouchella lonarensis TaxID=1464122 RepID=UPI000B84164B